MAQQQLPLLGVSGGPMQHRLQRQLQGGDVRRQQARRHAREQPADGQCVRLRLTPSPHAHQRRLLAQPRVAQPLHQRGHLLAAPALQLPA